ncbi:DUF2235 domain-containing protein [Streptomyces sp. NPDC001604]|uniref:DUF2235 domain-containing protein n=1 Tax=Streptomyces sp. NPDC001604 TaxID=3364593 RepID=UPI0036C1FAD2
MPRRIVVCLDGSGNQVGARNPTNVVRFYEMLEPGDPSRQLLYYDPGVGTMSSATARGPLGRRLSRLGGLAFGTGLKANLTEAYTYLMQHWQPGDAVYVFGFSRGAYTARALVGMLNKPGLMRPGAENLVPYAVAKYAFNQSIGIEKSEQEVARFSHAFCLRTEGEPLWEQVKRNDPRQVSHHALPVAYLGVWDTVKAAGLLRLGNLRWPYTHSLPNAARIRHAVSLDELRRPYREFLVRPRSPGPDTDTSTAEEVWFAGVHSDVGGTFDHAPDAPLLSTIPLKWITDGVSDDLDFRPGAYGTATALTEAFADAPVHHNGPAWILVGRRARPVPPEAVLHWSVRLRRERDPGYRPDLAGRERWADPDWFKPART